MTKIRGILHRLKDRDIPIWICLLTLLICLTSLLFRTLSASASEAHHEKRRRYVFNKKTVPSQEDLIKKDNNPIDNSGYIRELELEPGGSLETDYRYYEENCREDNRFDIRRARLFFSGNLNHFINYRIELELQGSDQKKLVDAYGESKIHKNFVLRFGQFKEPFSLEWQTPNSAIYFAERSMGYHLTPKRDVGVMLRQCLFKNSMYCFLGIFNGDGTDGSSRGGQSDEPELAGRLIFRPFAAMPWSWLKSFQIGGSATHAHIDLTNVTLEVQSTGMTGTNRNIYVLNANTKFGVLKWVRRRQRWALESAWVWRGMAIQGEYIHFRFTDMEPSGGLPQDAEFSSWYVSTLFCLTGESFEMQDGMLQPIKPRKDFDSESKSLGALVMSVRMEHFTGDETWITKTAFVSVRESVAYSMAINWIMTPALRLIMDYTFTNLSDPIRVRVNPKDGSIDYIEEEHVLTARIYLSF